MSAYNEQGQRSHEVIVREQIKPERAFYAVLYECDVHTAEGAPRSTRSEAIDSLREVIEAEHAGRLREIARVSETWKEAKQ